MSHGGQVSRLGGVLVANEQVAGPPCTARWNFKTIFKIFKILQEWNYWRLPATHQMRQVEL